MTEVRDAPTSPTASVKRICDAPGASSPASRNGHAPARSRSSAAATSRDAERDDHRRERGAAAVAEPAQAHAQRDRHPAEEGGRGERQEYGGHAGAGRPTSRRSRSDVRGLGDHDAGHDHEAAEPARHTEPVAGEGEAEEGGPHRLEREGERGLRGGRATLRPRLREERERAREDAGHEQRPPDRPAVRDGELTGEHGDDEQPRERGQHLDERERERVVPRRVALHQHDLQRVDRGAREHEQIPERRAAVHAGEQREPDRRKQHAAPRGGADPGPEAARARAAASARRTCR